MSRLLPFLLGVRGRMARLRLAIAFLLAASWLAGPAWGQTATSYYAGFNLLGNSSSSAVDVATAFGDPNRFVSVWKWDAANSRWDFYTPLQTDGGLAYGQARGYGQLASINAGEGFWLNARSAGSLSFLSGTAVSSASFQAALPDGFSLIATGDAYTPVQFNSALASTPPSPGVVPQSIATLWAWDPQLAHWYFYAPSLDQAGTLASYIQSHNYLDFATTGKTLGAGVGFWVNLGSSASVTQTPPSVATGVITGFTGGLEVGGRCYPDSRAGYDRMGERAGTDHMPASDARLGQEVVVDFDAAGNAISVHVAPSLIGPVEAVPPTTAADVITVAGVSVQINTDANVGLVTVFEGYTSLADIKVGDRVEVHGLHQVDASGNPYILGTRIEQKPVLCTPEPCTVRVSGAITSLDEAAGSFVMDGLTVLYGSAQILPTGQTLAVGQWVSALSDTAPVAGVLTATAVSIRQLAATTTGLTVSGPISDFVSAASFVVHGITVDASGVSLPAGGLADGMWVLVQGTFDPAGNTLVATVLAQTSPRRGSTHVEGRISNFVSQSNFMVRNVLVDASNAIFTGGTAADLQDNAIVEVRGSVSGSILLADTVAFKSQPPAGTPQDFSGQVSSYVVDTGAFTLTLTDGTTVAAILSNASFVGGTAADFIDGANVRVSGTLADGVLTVRCVRFLLAPVAQGNDRATHGREVGGIASKVVVAGSTTTFTLNRLTVSYAGTVPGLRSGMRVEVLGSVSGNNLAATAVRLEH